MKVVPWSLDDAKNAAIDCAWLHMNSLREHPLSKQTAADLLWVALGGMLGSTKDEHRSLTVKLFNKLNFDQAADEAEE